jgi:hypothetical protein
MNIHLPLVFYLQHSAYTDDDQGIHVHKIINKLMMNIAQEYFPQQATKKNRSFIYKKNISNKIFTLHELSLKQYHC